MSAKTRRPTARKRLQASTDCSKGRNTETSNYLRNLSQASRREAIAIVLARLLCQGDRILSVSTDRQTNAGFNKTYRLAAKNQVPSFGCNYWSIHKTNRNNDCHCTCSKRVMTKSKDQDMRANKITGPLSLACIFFFDCFWNCSQKSKALSISASRSFNYR